MPLTSAEIAQMSSVFQQQSMMNMQQSSLISQFAGGNARMGSENLVGSTLNKGVGMAMPIAGAGLMLAGMDPVSLGMKAAWGARGMGLMGAGAAGLGVAGAAAIPMMGAQYIGNQMMTGIQEQQQFAGQMRGAYQFSNQFGGRGFTGGQLASIGQSMQQQTMSRGPGGEFTTMDEMGRLASNMGRMGMAQGVRNAKDFGDKFQEMMKAVQEIAKQFSTSLEQAQQVMSSMRGSGVFGAGKQMAMAGAARRAATGGGLAMEEVTAMSGIGSNISRAIGGRGAAGASAGMQSIGIVGAALQAGVMSEEDIYNATGQTGAAGRQQMAATMLQGDAEFFRGAQGRRVLAAMAGKNGTLDPNAVRELQMGGVGTGRTMQMAYGHLGQVGKAGFIRNEGRLRGEALAAFGGLGKATVMKGWLEQRGFDLNGMDDRSMLAFQRFGHMDRDQAEDMLKMVQGLDRIKDQQSDAVVRDNVTRDVELQRKNQGLSGVKRKFEDARAKVQGTLREVGAAWSEQMTSWVEKQINTITGDYVRQVTDVSSVVREAREGNHAALSILGRKTSSKGWAGNDTQLRDMERFMGGSAAGGADWAKQNSETLSKAGFHLDMSGKSGSVTEQMSGLQDYQTALSGTVNKNSRFYSFGADKRDSIRNLFTSLKSSGGLDRVAELERGLEGMDSTRAKEMLAQLRSSNTRAEKAAKIRDMAAGAGMEKALDALGLPETARDLGRGFETATAEEVASKNREYMMGKRVEDYAGNAKSTYGAATGIMGKLWGSGLLGKAAMLSGVGAGIAYGSVLGQDARNIIRGSREQAETQSFSDYFRGEGVELSRSILSSDEKTRTAATEAIQDKLVALGNKGDQGLKDAYSLQLAASRIASGESVESVAKATGLTRAQVSGAQNALQTAVGVADYLKTKQARTEYARQAVTEQRGLLSDEDYRKRLEAEGIKGKDADRFISEYNLHRKTVEAGTKVETDPRELMNREEIEGHAVDDMSTEDLRKKVKMGTANPQEQSALSIREGSTAAKKSRVKGANLSFVAGRLGGSLSKEDAARIAKMKPEDQEAEMLKAMGLSEGDFDVGAGKDVKTRLKDVLDAQKSGKGVDAALKEVTLKDDSRKRLQKEDQDKQNKQASATDPSFRALNSIDKSTALMSKMTQIIAANTNPEAVAAALKEVKE